MKKCGVYKLCGEVEFRSVYCAPSRKFKILAIPKVLANEKSYEHGFTKKYDGHKLCAMSRAKSSFDWFFVHHLGNSNYRPFPVYYRAHGKSFKHSFAKKCNDHKLCTKSSFDRFFEHHLENSKY
ncbi:hypothetical protein GW17_00056348 [Ensete ventricosum]|nr:hypothetical protein GW17_00056348 [Ensete ventricosum]